ncbi:MAG TPA: hypothetical protein VE870_15170, partial [Bacteroidales bacterium]|nr:hypothetical protein [Bacteroidales bacterium]
MKIRTLLTAIFLGLFLPTNVMHAQAWMKELNQKKSASEHIDFYDVQRAFNTWWEENKTKTETTGEAGEEEEQGWEQFKRWEFFMEPRVYPEGNLELPSIYPQIKYL